MGDDTRMIKTSVRRNYLLLGTLLGVIVGVIFGFSLRPLEPSQNAILLISYPGELFMRLLKLLILPLIISSLIAGSAGLNAKLNGYIAVRTMVYFFLTSLLNASMGVILAVTIHPGNPEVKTNLVDYGTNSNKVPTSMLDSLLDLGRNVVSDNIFQATFQQTRTSYTNTSVQVYNSQNGSFEFTTLLLKEVGYRPGTNTLGIAFFCLLFGTVLGTMGEKSKAIVHCFDVMFEVVMKIVSGVMWLTPLGIASVISGKILSVANLPLVITNLARFIITVVIGVYIYQLVIMQLIYLAIVKKNPFKFYVGLLQGMCTAFATASEAAALPITFGLLENRLKVNTRITRFVLPIGCNINMDGTALFLAVASIFIAQKNNVVLGFGELVTVCFTSTVASFSSASVPSAGLVLLLIILSAIDTPTQDVSLLFAVDWIVDRFRTTNNLLGDCYAAAVVEVLSEKELKQADDSSQFSRFIPLQTQTV